MLLRLSSDWAIVRLARGTGAMSTPSSFSPAALPPEGVVPNFQHPRDVHYTANLTIAIVCLASFNLLFLSHLYVKWRVKRGTILLEDWFCMIAWVLVNGYMVSILMRCAHGEGRSLWEVSLTDYRLFLKWLYIGSVLYSPAAFFTKVTLLLLMARVFSVNKLVSRCIHIFIAILVLAYIPIEGLKIFICRPLSAFWDIVETSGVTGSNGKCFDQSVLFMCDIIIAIITDFLILIVPIPLVWSMDTTRRQKIKYIILLGAGGGATAMTMMRAYYNVKLMDSMDVTADVAFSSITSSFELAIGLSCACLPSASLLFEKVVHSVGLPSFHRAGSNREVPTAPSGSRKPSTTTTSSHWSSIVSKITMRTVSLTARGGYDTHVLPSRRNQHVDDDLEYGSRMSPVVFMFNNPLDVPSIRSTSEEGSRSSIDVSGLSLSDTADESQLDSSTLSSPKGLTDKNGVSGRQSPLDRDMETT